MFKPNLVKIRNYLKLHGLAGLASALRGRICPVRAECFSAHAGRLSNSRGVEVGGPSRIFSAKGFFPVYPLAVALDNVTFASRTIWEGELSRGNTFLFDSNRPPGKQFILDATSLREIENETYDFLLSSHVLEHLANPLRGLNEWKRVVREGGLLVIAIPHKDGTFDHLRPVTTIDHMVEDFEQGMDEDDVTHVAEALGLHDLNHDDAVSGREEFEARIRNNRQERSLHHHVFATGTLAQLIDYAGLQILSLETIRPCHIVAVAMKKSPTAEVDNKQYLDLTSRLYSRSPFPTDREAAR